ncbi:hypothetical protein H1P_1740014 [Hyella patelloides LEGE 07179]|uniref:TonB-dependent receptor plug domain-containing protein n=1 Tax=Hyella patelloides LEGE 07179 TaxID=945734 RepID=A0A563VNG9_9CYAN|nr:hypothetical protein H1P_1740014 [Hyella patelloides LEGE 07179]
MTPKKLKKLGRIEVTNGPTAIYGGQGTGGVVNIITRTPTEEGCRGRRSKPR